MKMHLAAILGVVMAGSVLTVYAQEQMAAKTEAAEKAAMTQTVFACPDCRTMALQAGKCSMCQKDMKEMHLLGTKDGQALMCSCGADCTCDPKGMKDGKCSCGKDVVKAPCTGMYV